MKPLPPLHPDRVARALKCFEDYRGSFDVTEEAELGEEYDTAIACLKAMRDFQKTCRLTPQTVDTAIAVRGFFENLKDLVHRRG